MGGPRLTSEQKRTAFRLHRQGLSHRAIARQLCCSQGGFTIMFRDHERVDGVADPWAPRPGRLNIEDREQILLGLARGDSLSAIARSIHRAPSRVTREVASSGGRASYVAWRAHMRAGSRPSVRSEPSSAGTVAGGGDQGPRGVLVASGDSPPLAVGLPGPTGDACEPRDRLPVALRAGAWGAAAGAGTLPALWPGQAQEPGPRRR